MMTIHLKDVPPADELVEQLKAAIEQTPIRATWRLPDLALAMLTGQLLLNARGVLLLCDGGLPGSAAAGARACVEGMGDSLFLALAKSGAEYANLGARAAVAAELALDRVHDGDQERPRRDREGA